MNTLSKRAWLSRRPRITALLVVALIAVIGSITLFLTHAQTPGTPFAANSFWNTPLPATTPVDPNTSNYINWIQQDLSQYSGNGDINTAEYTPPIYTVPSGLGTVQFKFNDCQGKGSTPTDLMSQISAVPVPSYAQPSAGTDQEMVIYQPSTDTLWETWGTQRRSDGWYACWGGKISGVSTSSGIFPPYFGVTASGLAMLGGTIRASELQTGVINHVVGLSIIRTGSRNVGSSSNDTSFSNSFVWPADRYDGYSNDTNAPVEGTRFRLDPSINVDALNITPTAKAIAHAAQNYGLVLWDTSGVVGFRAENSIAFTGQGQPNPYNAIFGSTPSYQQLAGFPWSKLQVLPAGYGKSGLPTPSPTPNSTPSPTPTPYVPQVSQTNNLLTGKDLVASDSAVSGYPTTYANDTNESTRWISGATDNITLSADLGANYNLNKVSILWAADTTKDYTIQVSTDNATWMTVGSGTTSNTPNQLINTTFSGVGRYFRIVANTRWNTSYGNSIWEIGLYGTAAPAITPTPTPSVVPTPTASPTPTKVPTPTPAATPVSVTGDISGDGHVTSLDLAILLSHWNITSGATRAQGDLSGDGKITSLDLAILLSNWGR
jgi:hypothetical protein